MKAIVLDKIGKPNVLKISEIEIPNIKEDQVLVKIKYSGINFADLLSRQGLYSWSPKRPYVLGLEASGIVEKIGSAVTTIQIGDKVIVGSQTGCYAEFVAVVEAQVFPLPESFSFKEGAAFVANWATVWIALHEMARVRSNESILIHAAAGGVGTAAVHLALAFGMKVYGTASSQNKRDMLEELGVTALSYENFDTYLLANPPNCILETIGGDVYRRSFKVLAPLGRIILIGASGIEINKWNPFSWINAWRAMPKTNITKVVRFSKAFMGLHIGYLLNNIDDKNLMYNNLVSFVEKHQLKPVIREDQIFPLSDVAMAHQLIHDRKNIGKVLLEINV